MSSRPKHRALALHSGGTCFPPAPHIPGWPILRAFAKGGVSRRARPLSSAPPQIALFRTKFAKGYPRDENILFQSPDCAVLYQGGLIAFDKSIDTPENLVEVLELFFEYRRPHEVDWEESVIKFSARIPELANGVKQILADEYRKNATFRENFESFADLCRQSINHGLSGDAIRNMLVQHLLTERIFRKAFDNQELLRRNVIAAEIEKVIQSITSRHFSRDAFLKNLDHFYTAIEKAAETQTGYTEKQHFLNAVYEKFFQSFDTKQADTMGIVYTPQPIVDFMVRSVDEILQQEFGKTLSDKGVHILDSFTNRHPDPCCYLLSVDL